MTANEIRQEAIRVLREKFPEYGIDENSKFQAWCVSREGANRVSSRDFSPGDIVSLYPWASRVETAMDGAIDPVFAARNECARVLVAMDRDADDEGPKRKPYVLLYCLAGVGKPGKAKTNLAYSHEGPGIPLVSGARPEDVVFSDMYGLDAPGKWRRTTFMV